MKSIPPASYALAAALLFGASTPAAKLLLGQLSPQLLAGLFYLGSGFGLTSYLLVSGSPWAARTWRKVRRGDLLWLTAATVCGGIFGPLLLMLGLSSASAASSSLLLNLEGVFTALLAWIAFKEHTNRRIILGMIAIAIASLVLSVTPGQDMTFSLASFAIICACFCWALDNNLTRNISDADPAQLAAIKGIVAGTVNCLIGISAGSKMPSLAVTIIVAGIGFLGYGISLTLYIKSLRLLGTARTGAYFSTAPFAGTLVSLLFLHEPLTSNLLIAGLLMGLGVSLHLTERHSHEHVHLATEHEHMHSHDEHHMHEHGPDDPAEEPHTHSHKHIELRHSHPHFPDSEHRHEHEDACQ